jgi:4-amino-4-deoxy-L-arabinose transferase-like glycosyltransferase
VKQRFYMFLVVIVLVAAVLRLVNLGLYPQRFNQDEMAQGYDAWSIWRIGHDQHGEFFPLQFRNFNDYVPPVANYLTAPFVGLLGLDETTRRWKYLPALNL